MKIITLVDGEFIHLKKWNSIHDIEGCAVGVGKRRIKRWSGEDYEKLVISLTYKVQVEIILNY